MSLQRIPIFGYDQGGLNTYKKPLLLNDQQFQVLENFYPYRERLKKREGLKFLGRLQRNFTAATIGTTVASQLTYNFASLFAGFGVVDALAEIEPGSLIITIGAPDTATFTDLGNGTFSVTGKGVSGHVDYTTSQVVINISSSVGGATIQASFSYFPTRPVMGITQYEQPGINTYTTVFFDTKYAYTWNGTNFTELAPGTTWAGTDSDFFWTTNYRGVTPDSRLFFATNFVNDAADPMRYYNSIAWTTFAPAVDAANTLFQARILIPYFGRLLALNVWEGTSIAASKNIFNRCRFSAVGDPTAVNAWRSDIFGQGGFLDAPTNEMIINATFLNNTLIVFFEKTTWQLRYVGEYGLPFIWERIASDLGSDSTFSPILFNNHLLAIGDKAIIAADTNNVDRIDLEIPDQIFLFQDLNNGVERVQGVRDYQKELVYWNYPESGDLGLSSSSLIYPNKVLVYNYRNKKWAKFRDSITAFGTFQLSDSLKWGAQNVFWSDQSVKWNDPDTNENFPSIVAGNQEGFIHLYGYTTPDNASLTIQNITVTNYGTPAQVVTLNIPNHNLMNEEIIYLYPNLFVTSEITSAPQNINFISNTGAVVATDLNNRFFEVTVIDANNVTLEEWNFQSQEYENDFSFIPNIDNSTVFYVGGGQATLMQEPLIQTKDFNPFQTMGLQTKLSYIDFLMDSVETAPYGMISAATNANPCQITSNAHGLKSGQNITIAGVQGMTQLNVGQYFTIIVIDSNNFTINVDSTNYGVYVSGGIWTLLAAALTVNINLNSSNSISGNMFVGGKETRTPDQAPFYGPASDYTWQRFYATCVGQYFNLLLTYDDNLMNTLWVHQQELEVHGMILNARQGGKLPF